MLSFTGSTENAVEASFLLSLRIGKCGKGHTIVEELLLPVAKDIVSCMSDEPYDIKQTKRNCSS